MIEYLGNPENAFPSRVFLSTDVLGYKNEQQIHQLFNYDELHEIDREALDIRRKRYGAQLSRVDDALLRQAKAGDVSAIKLAYQRLEGWVERKAIEAKIIPGEGLKEILIGMWGRSGTERPEDE